MGDKMEVTACNGGLIQSLNGQAAAEALREELQKEQHNLKSAPFPSLGEVPQRRRDGTLGQWAGAALGRWGVVLWTTRQHSTAQHSTAQHSTAQHSTAQHSTAQHSTAQQHNTAQHSTSQHSTTQHCTAQHNTARPRQGASHVTEGLPGPEQHDGVGVAGTAPAPAGGERGSTAGTSGMTAVAWSVTPRFLRHPSFRR